MHRTLRSSLDLRLQIAGLLALVAIALVQVLAAMVLARSVPP